MFLTCDIEDNLRVLPSELGSDTLEAVTAVIEEAYLDFVVPDCGLVVSLYDIRRVEGGFIYHSEGAVHFDVQFTVVVFRPLLGELLVGTLVKSSKYDPTCSLLALQKLSISLAVSQKNSDSM